MLEDLKIQLSYSDLLEALQQYVGEMFAFPIEVARFEVEGANTDEETYTITVSRVSDEEEQSS